MSTRVLGPSADVELADVINKVKNDIFYSLNCIQIGKIELYDPITNSASVSINFQRKVPIGNPINYPILLNCPVFILSGGGTSVQVPIAKEDQCIVLFNDRNIDDWWISGDVKIPPNGRAHDIADGIVLVGISNIKSAKPTSTSTIRIDAADKKIAIKNNVTDLKTLLDTLFTQLNTLITDIRAITVTTPSGPSTLPLLNDASFATAAASLSTLKTQFGTLLNEGLT